MEVRSLKRSEGTTSVTEWSSSPLTSRQSHHRQETTLVEDCHFYVHKDPCNRRPPRAGPKMALLIREMYKSYKYLFVELSDPRIHDLPLMASPLPMLSIIAVYIYFVQVLGPRWMKDRQPFVLDRIIQVYDASQIVVSLYIAYHGLRLCWWCNYSWFCEPVDYSFDPEPVAIARLVYLYFVVKIVDLLDTVFFVLRKKNNQISYLHLYHHANMVWGSWVTAKYLAGGHLTFIGQINSMVHAVMYSYYLITSMYPQYKNNIWWKKHITQMQMIQFVLIGLHNFVASVQSTCSVPKWISMGLVPQSIFMAAMFYDFYKKAYSPKAANQRDVKVEVEERDKKSD